VAANDLEIAKLLLEQGVPVNLANRAGHSPTQVVLLLVRLEPRLFVCASGLLAAILVDSGFGYASLFLLCIVLHVTSRLCHRLNLKGKVCPLALMDDLRFNMNNL
jgi:hypothetical protein